MDKFTKITSSEMRREQTTVISTIFRRDDIILELHMLQERRRHEITMLDERIAEQEKLLAKCDELKIE